MSSYRESPSLSLTSEWNNDCLLSWIKTQTLWQIQKTKSKRMLLNVTIRILPRMDAGFTVVQSQTLHYRLLINQVKGILTLHHFRYLRLCDLYHLWGNDHCTLCFAESWFVVLQHHLRVIIIFAAMIQIQWWTCLILFHALSSFAHWTKTIVKYCRLITAEVIGWLIDLWIDWNYFDNWFIVLKSFLTQKMANVL